MFRWLKLIFFLSLLPSLALAQTITDTSPTGSEQGMVVRPIGQHNQGTAAADTDPLFLAGCVRTDTAAVATGVVNGDRARCIVDATGQLWVHVGTIDGGTITTITNPVTVQQSTASNLKVDLSGTAANSTAIKVDGSAVTQPVSGTVTVTDGAGALNVIVDSGSLTANAGTNLNTSALNLEATQSSVLTSVQLIDDIVHASDAALGKVAAIGAQFDDVSPGTTTENNVRPLRMSTRRELYGQIRDAAGNERGANVNASNELNVSAAVTSVPSNQSVNVAQIAGNTTLTGNGVTGAGSQRVTIASDNTAFAVNARVNDGTTTAVVDPTLAALRVSARPPEILGCYAVNGNTSYGTTTANTILFSFRWGDATRIALIQKVQVFVVATAVTTAGLVERQLIAVRSFTASDTSGTAITPAANNAEMRTSFPTSLATDIRVGVLTAGTGTADANPISSMAAWMGGVGNVIGGAQPVTLFDATSGSTYPMVLAQNEGFRVKFGAAETASTRQTFVNVVWCEANAY